MFIIMLIRPTTSGWIGSDVVGGLAVVGGEHHVRDARSPMPRRSVVIGVGGCCARACRLPRELCVGPNTPGLGKSRAPNDGMI
jgi:hypothetical protein